jgi:anionic cell wall polymer biosynthesis LytR-Cps2A-Psr (LCP) family protein
MYRGTSARLFPIVIVIVIIAIVVMTIVTVGRAIFGGNSAGQVNTDTASNNLVNTSVNSSVRMRIRGPIVASEDFKTTQIEISPNKRTAAAFIGYSMQPAGSAILDNTTKGYEEFVYALNRANLMKGTQLAGDDDDTRGVCATGYLYEFDMLSNDKSVKHLWTSSCRGINGSLRTSLSQVKALFTKQIPRSSQILSKIDH